jgi:hypothetical protein
MSDRTQMVSVELTREEAEHLLLHAALDGGFHSGCDKLRSALIQPEHQGAMKWGCTCHGVNDYPVAVVPVASLPVRPPAPVLSDHAGGRLREIADVIETASDSRLCVGDAALLRNLASQEHKGEAGKDGLNMSYGEIDAEADTV